MKNKLFVVVSGEICSGKSTLSNNLNSCFGFKAFHTRDLIAKLGNLEKRKDLQQLGAHLDKRTKGSWVRDYFLKETYYKHKEFNFFSIDSVRISNQIKYLRESFGTSVVHVHLSCSPNVLYKRYIERNKKKNPGITLNEIKNQYFAIKSDPTEKQVNSLIDLADLKVNTERLSEKDVYTKVASFLGILSKLSNPCVDVVIGGQFGSEAKGQICAYLAPDYDALVRVGGPNAGHSVYAVPDPYVFHILPSGSIKSLNAKLIIGPGAVINIDTLKTEIEKYKIYDTDRLVIDYNATIITKEDIKKEENIVKRIGSTGQGVGAATANNILNRNSDNKNKAHFFEKELKGYLGSASEALEKVYRNNGKVLLEGTQGTMLSIHHGLYPFVTSRDTTVNGCIAEAGISPRRLRKIILVTRCYPIRVESPENGTSGSFESTELEWKQISKRSGVPLAELLEIEKTSTTKRRRRVAEFSWYLFRKSCELNSPTDIALTFVDYINVQNKKARRFEQLTSETIEFIDEIERCSEAPVSLISTRFDYRSIIDRRSWKFKDGY